MLLSIRPSSRDIDQQRLRAAIPGLLAARTEPVDLREQPNALMRWAHFFNFVFLMMPVRSGLAQRTYGVGCYRARIVEKR